MPTLNWIGKEAVVNHHHKVPFHLLKDVPELSVGDPGSGNLIVQGDNLVALKALLPYYAGQVKCIYIDPPYNTGNEGWVYNDNVNSPLIRDWLGKVVGDEASDLSRHDKWLCMMYPRLQLLRKFLRHDGFICVQINESEGAHLQKLLDDIFGSINHLTTLYVQVRYADKTLKQDMSFHKQVEQVLIYGRTTKAQPRSLRAKYNYDKFRWRVVEKEQGTEEVIGGKKVKIFPKGSFELHEEETGASDRLKEIWASGAVLDGNSSGRFFRDFLAQRVSKDGLGVLYKVYGIGEEVSGYRYFTGPKKLGAMRGKYYQGVPTDKLNNKNSVVDLPIPGFYDMAADFGNCRHEGGVDFKSGKKPLKLLRLILDHFADDPNCLVMDSFAGSGTTGHAVLQLNQEAKENRRYILVQLPYETDEQKQQDFNICRETTAKRIKNVIEGQDIAAPVHSGFRYCELGEPMFDERGQIKPTVRFPDLARHVYFTETGEPLPNGKPAKSALLHVCGGVAIYLLFNGILGDKSVDGGNVLTRPVLAKLPKHDGPKVIYAAGCRLGKESLRAEQITFRQTPYEIKVT